MLYLIQKHNATHLHYDLRLEMDGKLRSWAIPKTPPTEKGIKRLAIQTEDHSVEYADFEGIISVEDSGDGSVEIWDKGTYDIKENKDDIIVVFINGKKLEGRYCLVKFRQQEKNWLFFKY